MDNFPPLKDIFIVHYSIKFGTECPEKNGENRRIWKNIFHY